MVVAMLAILKAGGVCVPLNPEHPEERVKKMIAATSATIILTLSEYEPRLIHLVKSVVAVDKDETGLQSATSNGEVRRTVTPENAAFVIFTSGSSTGTPKGVILQHRNVCTSAKAHGHSLSIGPSSRVFQYAAYTFDISIQDHFTTLTRGGCVCIPSEHEVCDFSFIYYP